MAQGNSGSFTLSGSQNFAVIIYWSETYNETANTHVVSITAAQIQHRKFLLRSRRLPLRLRRP